MSQIECSVEHLQATINHLQDGGRLNRETMVLWLASKGDQSLRVVQVHKPDQQAARDIFRILPESMRSLMKHLREDRLKIVAQVHSHPMEAFHSRADDEWAIVRHEGAISIVLPYFARGISPATFFQASATFRLSAYDSWDQVPNADISRHVRVV